jgi:hypothetical protein
LESGDPIRTPEIAATLLLSLVALVCGCTTIRVESADDHVRIVRHFGVLAVSVGEPTTSHVAEVTGVGLVRSPWGWSAGYTHQSWAAIGPECRLVIWASTSDQHETARRLADPRTGICVAKALSLQPKEQERVD